MDYLLSGGISKRVHRETEIVNVTGASNTSRVTNNHSSSNSSGVQ